MSEPIALFLAIVITSTIAITLSVVLALHVVRRAPEPWPKRIAMAIVLPWGAIETWRNGRHVLPAFWAIAVIAYVALRIAAASQVG